MTIDEAVMEIAFILTGNPDYLPAAPPASDRSPALPFLRRKPSVTAAGERPPSKPSPPPREAREPETPRAPSAAPPRAPKPGRPKGRASRDAVLDAAVQHAGRHSAKTGIRERVSLVLKDRQCTRRKAEKGGKGHEVA